MILLRNGNLFDPKPQGPKDLLLAGGKLVVLADQIPAPEGLPIEVVDLAGARVVPGLVDGHTHIAGAGGEGGPATRTPEMQLSQFLSGGVTSTVGCLGTDGYTRTIASLLMKARGLKQEGLGCWIYTGSYQVPTPTLCGEVAHDLCYIDEIVGAGEIAIADHRSSSPTTDELVKLAKQVHVGGLLGGKAGMLHLHMGDAPETFQAIYDALAACELPQSKFYPTHINRNRDIFAQAKTYGLTGPLDITTSSYPYFPDEEVHPAHALAELLAAGVPLKHITMSSDAGGSLPRFDEQGKLTGVDIGHPSSLLATIRSAVEEKVPFAAALQTVTLNPARILCLKGKGNLIPGNDADLVVIEEDFSLRHVIAAGKFMVRDGVLIHKGTFE